MKRDRSHEPAHRPSKRRSIDRDADRDHHLPASLKTSVSPPPLRRRRLPGTASKEEAPESTVQYASLKTSAVESGTAQIEDHLTFFSTKLGQSSLPLDPSNSSRNHARLPNADFVSLYKRNQHRHGHHFVIHQHDHPVAGTHYDLRLQINESSSISWAIMYGLPGNSGSRRLNRNATETRVHCLWNHLIETASHTTGSMIIWDTGEYEVVPKMSETTEAETSQSDASDAVEEKGEQLTESQKLEQAFRNHKIHLRLHGTKLPPGYTIYIRLTKENDTIAQLKKPVRRRRKLSPETVRRSQQGDTSPSEDSGPPTLVSISTTEDARSTPATHSDSEDSETIRLTNSYPGAMNTVGSIHQRKWYLSLDRRNSGFVPTKDPQTKKNVWVRKKEGDGTLKGFEAFLVRGREGERSVITGRLAGEVLRDEGVEGFVPRGLWRPVTE